MSDQVIFRTFAPDDPYTRLPNTLCQNTDLDLRLVAILINLLSRRGDFTATISSMAKMFKLSRMTMYRLIGEAVEARYMIKLPGVATPRNRGRFAPARYAVFASPATDEQIATVSKFWTGTCPNSGQVTCPNSGHLKKNREINKTRSPQEAHKASTPQKVQKADAGKNRRLRDVKAEPATQAMGLAVKKAEPTANKAPAEAIAGMKEPTEQASSGGFVQIGECSPRLLKALMRQREGFERKRRSMGLEKYTETAETARGTI